MSYGADDPRKAIAAGQQAPARANLPAQFRDFTRLEPDEISDLGSRTWWTRGQHVVIAYSLLRAGERLERVEQPDEYMALFTDSGAAAEVTAGQDKETVTDRSVAVVPAGKSRLEVHTDTTVVRLFSAQAADLVERCSNRAAYEQPDRNVAPYRAWPEPVDGPRVRVYAIDDYPYEQGRFGRLFRCSTVMVNVFDADLGPRDTAHLSPHHHDDFEQYSLTVTGRWKHHIRTPWTKNLADWRDDEHVEVASPSVTVIPPPAVHTSRAIGHGLNQLIDVFAPPRADFSERPGWVLNSEQYPMPAQDAL